MDILHDLPPGNYFVTVTVRGMTVYDADRHGNDHTKELFKKLIDSEEEASKRRREGEECCHMDDKGNFCDNDAVYWIGNELDEYTLACAEHVEDLKGPMDKVKILSRKN